MTSSARGGPGPARRLAPGINFLLALEQECNMIDDLHNLRAHGAEPYFSHSHKQDPSEGNSHLFIIGVRYLCTADQDIPACYTRTCLHYTIIKPGF